MIEIIPRPWKQLINRVKLHTKQWTRPTTSAIVAGWKFPQKVVPLEAVFILTMSLCDMGASPKL